MFSQQNLKVNSHEVATTASQVNKPSKSPKKTKAAAAPIWTEDFANGIPSTWTMYGHNGNQSTVLLNADWEYRGPLTTPTNAVGSQGAWAGTVPTPIQSPTTSNGFIIFDSDYLDNAGVQGAAGTGSVPTPHVGELTTDSIDLSGYPNVQLTLHSYSRFYAGRALLAFSTDGGLTWADTINIHPNLVVNGSTSTDELVTINVSNMIGGSNNARIMFIYDGATFGSAAGLGYYYWMLDDLSIEEIPAHSFSFVPVNSAPKHDIKYEGGTKYGNMLFNQTVPVSFDANILNFGTNDQTNVKMEVEIVRNGVTDTVLSSSIIPLLTSGSIADFTQIFTPSYKPTLVGQYDCVFRVFSDSVPNVINSFSPIDTAYTFWVNPVDTPTVGHGLDFRVSDNSLGTGGLGDDGSAVASRMTFRTPTDTINGLPKVAISHVDIRFSSITTNGGDVMIECYEATGFDFVNGFGSTALFSKTYTLSGSSGSLTRFQINSCANNPIYLIPDSSYYFVVTMFSNGGANPIAIMNDQTVDQSGSVSIMYITSDARWYSGYANGSRVLASPHIRVLNNSEANNILEDVHTACSSFTWSDGNTYTTSNNTALDTLTSLAGCDSIIRLNLTILSNSISIDAQSDCGPFVWQNGVTYYASNSTVLDTLVSSMGCDSVVQLNLTIVPASISTDTQISCDPYTWINGKTYSASNNTATDTLVAASGCDSIVSLDLTIDSVNIGLTVMDPSIMVDSLASTYQWLSCDSVSGFVPILGANSQMFTALQNGWYAVAINNGNCSDTSECILISTVSLEENIYFEGVSFYPNPSSGLVNLDLGDLQSANLKIYDLKGKLLLEKDLNSDGNLKFELRDIKGVFAAELRSKGLSRHFRIIIQ